METDRRYSTNEYLAEAETHARRELLFGLLREPPAPFYGHQVIVTRVTVLLDEHVRRERLGAVVVSPVDVILDDHKALILQPDVVFISSERRALADQQINGAPDLAVEVESPGSQHYDRVTKLQMYREYGVREYWLINPLLKSITVIDLGAPKPIKAEYTGDSAVCSRVIPGFATRASAFFE